MKILKKVLNVLSLISLIGGIFIIIFAYLGNKTFISYITKLLEDAKFGGTLKHMLIGIGLIILALVLFVVSLRLSSKIRKREKQRLEEEKTKRIEQEKVNQQIREEAEIAKADAKHAREEAEAAQNELREIKGEYSIDNEAHPSDLKAMDAEHNIGTIENSTEENDTKE